MKIDPKKSVSSEPQKSTSTPSASTDPVAIEVRAYELWVERGCPIGSPEVDWYRAERELRGNPGTANAA